MMHGANIVFVGAWGTWMSGLAMMLYDLGYHNIVCINDVENDLTDKLARSWLQVVIGHGKYSVKFHDVVVYADIDAIIDWPELRESRAHQQATTHKYFHISLSYAEFLAEISKRFLTLAVAWSNGKTSTTAMAIWALEQLTSPVGGMQWSKERGRGRGLFWLGLLWGLLPNFDNQGYALCQDDHIKSDIKHLFDHMLNQKHQLDYSLLKKYVFVLEAGEYKDHFLHYDIDYALITNIERDHRDYFLTWESYKDAFRHLIDRTRYQVIVTQQVLDVLEIPVTSSSPSIPLPVGWGKHPRDNHSHKIVLSEPFEFDNEYLIGSYDESNAGMVKDLLSVIARNETIHSTINNDELEYILSQFKGAGRRMEYLGKIGAKLLYSDYGHHAPALEGNVQALQKKFPDRPVCVVFQPHQAQRVLAWRDEFKQALDWADKIVVYRLYTAREDFQALQAQYSALSELSNFEELGQEFAQHLWWKYITEIEELWREIQKFPDNAVIVYFSAWDLDRELRQTLR